MALTAVVGAEEHHLCENSAGDLVGLDLAETQSSLIHCKGGFCFSSPFTSQKKGTKALLIAWLGFLTLYVHQVPLESSDRNLITAGVIKGSH